MLLVLLLLLLVVAGSLFSLRRRIFANTQQQCLPSQPRWATSANPTKANGNHNETLDTYVFRPHGNTNLLNTDVLPRSPPP